MGFMDRLAANPSGSGGIFGQPRRENDNDVLSIVNKLRDREMSDYKDKAYFDDDRALRQEMRMRNRFDPSANISGNQTGQINNAGVQPMGTMQASQVEQQQQQPNIDFAKELAQQKLAQEGKLGSQALEIKDAQQKLVQSRNDQINEDRDLDRTRKTEEADRRIALAERTLRDRTASSEARLQAAQDLAAIREERYNLDREQKDKHFSTTSEQQAQRIKILEEQLAQRGLSTQETNLNEDGTKKVVETRRGSAAESVRVVDRWGRQTSIPKDKLNDPNEQALYGWKPVGGG